MNKLRWVVCLSLLLTGSAVYSQAMYFLADGPRLTAADNELFKAAAGQALNDTANDESVKWSNPDTGARGVITPLDTVIDDVYGVCRHVRVSNEARGKRRSGVYRACKATNGTWRLLDAGAVSK